MVVNIIAHMVHSPPIHNDCFVNKDFIILLLLLLLLLYKCWSALFYVQII